MKDLALLLGYQEWEVMELQRMFYNIIENENSVTALEAVQRFRNAEMLLHK